MKKFFKSKLFKRRILPIAAAVVLVGVIAIVMFSLQTMMVQEPEVTETPQATVALASPTPMDEEPSPDGTRRVYTGSGRAAGDTGF